ncbi:zeta-coat protein, putative [Entamoeba invadens IP1]|uniref:Zeta-coat protein, putative n=1 Tax=Entamoeba invadens IP1 TaxID=370355 RepID=A0A0A1U5N8_ENTIV|nr:zeta-coat protein, putative [Entamoeba invadens IP1]ELP88175.1 zeta-coat protein, putative [Entamoeba invadens IP1]|eukprot:XP_004254946.1 zeta-coat protein, putative [Entamoeba invadens IP1]
MTSPTIKALLITDLDGKRLYSKFYDKNPSVPLAKQIDIEERISKSVGMKGNSELFLLDKYVVIYNTVSDLIIAALTDPNENELFVNTGLSCIVDAFNIIFKKGFDKKVALEFYDKVAITIDEVIDDGIILEVDPEAVANRVNFKNVEGSESSFADVSLSGALSYGKGYLLGLWRGK